MQTQKNKHSNILIKEEISRYTFKHLDKECHKELKQNRQPDRTPDL